MIESPNLKNVENSSVEESVKNDFDLELTNIERVQEGYSNEVYKANLDDQVVFIRINKDPNVFAVEQLGYKRFEAQGIPIPNIIAYKENPESLGYPTMIMSAAEGMTLKDMDASDEQKDQIYEHVGETLHKINETKLEGFGPLKVHNQELVGEFSTWEAYCRSQDEYNHTALSFCLENKFVTNEDARRIKEIYSEIASLDLEKASLLHTDMHASHFFVKGSDISGIIDLGSLKAGDPRYDIAMSLVFQKPRQQEAFKKGYGKLANDPIVDKYLITIAIRKIYFRSKDDINGNVKALLPVLRRALKNLAEDDKTKTPY